MRKYRARHSQPRSTRPRIPTGTSLLDDLRREVEHECTHYGVSRSWVLALALAKHFDLAIPDEADYRTKPWAHGNGRSR